MNIKAIWSNSKPETRITLTYFVFGLLWVTFSDLVIENLVQDRETLARIGLIKGWVFIILTSAMVFLLIKKQSFHQRLVEKKLRERELQYRESCRELQIIIDSIPSSIIYKNENNIILRANRFCAEAVGTSPQAMVGISAKVLFPQNAQQQFQDDLRVIQTGQPRLGVVEKINTSTNTIKWIETNKIPIKTERGLAAELVVITSDITERKLAENKRLKQQALLEAIINDIPDALMITDLQRRIVLTNPGTSRIFGYHSDEITGKRTVMFYQNKKEFNQQADITLSPYIVNYRRKNGEQFLGETIGAIIRDINGQPLGYLGLVRDVTDRMAMEQESRELRERLAHVNRLGTMNEMTAGIAHEINQPLTAIANYAQASRRLLESDPASPRLLEALQKISTQAIRAGDIIRQLRDFIKQRESRHERVDCNELIRQVVLLAEVDTRDNHIPVVVKLAENLPVASVDPVQIQQVILNLIRNSIEAILSINPEHPKL